MSLLSPQQKELRKRLLAEGPSGALSAMRIGKLDEICGINTVWLDILPAQNYKWSNIAYLIYKKLYMTLLRKEPSSLLDQSKVLSPKYPDLKTEI